MKPVIAASPTHKSLKLRLDRKLYALRFRVEWGFHALKRFRAVATRHDKTATISSPPSMSPASGCGSSIEDSP